MDACVDAPCELFDGQRLRVESSGTPGPRRAPAADSAGASVPPTTEERLSSRHGDDCPERRGLSSSTRFLQRAVDELLERRRRLRAAQEVAVDDERRRAADAGVVADLRIGVDLGLVLVRSRARP